MTSFQKLLELLREHYGEDYNTERWHDLGEGHAYMYTSWAPDRELNPQYDGIPDVPRFGAMVAHTTPDGKLCFGAIHFATPEVNAVNAASKAYCQKKGIPYHGDYPQWQVQSFEPLSVSPSLLCGSCKDHGFIRNGKWVKA